MKPALIFPLFIARFYNLLYSDNIFCNHMTMYNINCISQRNLYIRSLLTEIKLYIGLAVNPL